MAPAETAKNQAHNCSLLRWRLKSKCCGCLSTVLNLIQQTCFEHILQIMADVNHLHISFTYTNTHSFARLPFSNRLESTVLCTLSCFRSQVSANDTKLKVKHDRCFLTIDQNNIIPTNKNKHVHVKVVKIPLGRKYSQHFICFYMLLLRLLVPFRLNYVCLAVNQRNLVQTRKWVEQKRHTLTGGNNEWRLTKMRSKHSMVWRKILCY